jgi:hypothetical protein
LNQSLATIHEDAKFRVMHGAKERSLRFNRTAFYNIGAARADAENVDVHHVIRVGGLLGERFVESVEMLSYQGPRGISHVRKVISWRFQRLPTCYLSVEPLRPQRT